MIVFNVMFNLLSQQKQLYSKNWQTNEKFKFDTSFRTPRFFIETNFLWNQKVLTAALYFSTRSILVTDVADEMCWWQLWDVGDGFGGHFGHTTSAIFLDQHSIDVIKIEIESPTFTYHQHLCSHIYVVISGERVVTFFIKDVVPRWVSNHGSLHRNCRDK